MKVVQVTKPENDKYIGLKDDQGHWYECSKAVRDYVEKFLPCDIEVSARNGDVISKVDIAKKDQTYLTNAEEDLIKKLEGAVQAVVQIAGEITKQKK